MSGRAKRRAARLVGIVAGLAALSVAILANRPERLPPQLGAAVSVRVASGGAIRLGPSGGPVLAAASLRPGDQPLRGRVALKNRGRVPLRVALRPVSPGEARYNAPWHAVELKAGRHGELAFGSVAEQMAGHGFQQGRGRPGVVIPGGGRLSVPLHLAIGEAALDGGGIVGEELRLVLTPVREPVR